MSAELLGVVVCHGPLAPALVAAVEEVSGVRGGLIPVSNSGCDREQIERKIEAAMGDRPGLIFVDMPSGSCLFAALRQRPNASHQRIVTGVNLAMLLDFVFHRQLEPAAAASRALEVGARAMVSR